MVLYFVVTAHTPEYRLVTYNWLVVQLYPVWYIPETELLLGGVVLYLPCYLPTTISTMVRTVVLDSTYR